MARKRPVISATDAAKTFGRLVDRVREERAVYIVERGGVPVAQIAPVTGPRCKLRDLADLLRTAGGLDEGYLKTVETRVRKANRPVVPRDPWKS